MIPKVIHYIWLSDNSIPENNQKCIDSWSKKAPSFVVKKWTLKDFDLNVLPLFVKQAIEKEKWAFACDYLRAYVLYKEGGLYLDSDVFMLKDIEPYLNHSFISAVEFFSELFDDEEQKHVNPSGEADKEMIKGIALNAAMMASEANNVFLKDVLDYYAKINFINEDGSFNTAMLAPHVYAYIATKYGFKYQNKSQDLLNDMYLYPSEVFAESFSGITPNSALVHMCAASWRDDQDLTSYHWKQTNELNYLENRDYSRPYLSIIVLCYKVANYLPQCLESIRRQTFKDFEVIMVNDGSPDSCGAICNAYVKMDPRFKVIHKENGGIIAARKDALNMAKGIWAGSVDGDDWISLDMYKTMWETQCAYNADIVQTRYLLHYTNHSENVFSKRSGQVIYYSEKDYKEILSNDKYFENHIIEVSLCRSIVKTDDLRMMMNKLDDDCSLCEDAVCMYVCAANAKNLCVVNKEHYHYRVRSNSCTTSIKSRDVNKLYKLLEIARHEIINKELGDRILKQLEMYFIQHLFTSFLMNIKDSINPVNEYIKYINDDRFQQLMHKFGKELICEHFNKIQVCLLYKNKGYEMYIEEYCKSEYGIDYFE